MGVTIRQISEKCGLSVSAVSKALNGHSDINEGTRARVLQTAREMGYVPDAAARGLKLKHTYNLGILLEDHQHSGLLNSHFVLVVENFRREAEARGYDITLLSSHLGVNMVSSYYEHCVYRRIDGVFIACVDFETPQIRELAESHIPAAVLDRPFSHCVNVLSDNAPAMEEAVLRGAALGHTRIAYIHGTDSYVTAQRIQGYQAGLQAAGLPFRGEYLVQGRYNDAQACAQCTRQLLALPQPPTLILMTDDVSARGGLEALAQAGLRVPQDVSVVGFDGDDSPYRDMSLTTLCQETAGQGRAAARLLIEHIEQGPDEECASCTLPVHWYPGSTLAAPAGQG